MSRVIERKGAATLDVLAEILPAIIKSFPWPKAMRWGAPPPSRCAALGAPAAFDRRDLRAGDGRPGHRAFRSRRHPGRQHHLRPSLHGAGSPSKCGASTITCRRWRRPKSCSIRRGAATSSCMTQGPRLRAGAGAGRGRGAAARSRGPRRMAGGADGRVRRQFLDIPGEVIRATIRANQKCFVLRDPRDREARRTSSCWCRTLLRQRRRQGHRRRQWAGGAGAPLRRALFLEDRSGALPDYADKASRSTSGSRNCGR